MESSNKKKKKQFKSFLKIHDINQVSNPCLFRGMSHGSEILKMADHTPPPLLLPFGSADFGSLYVLSSCEVVWWGEG